MASVFIEDAGAGDAAGGERAGVAGAVGALGETGDSARGGGDARGVFADEKVLMTDGGDGGGAFLDPENGRELKRFAAGGTGRVSFVVSADGTRMLAWGRRN